MPLNLSTQTDDPIAINIAAQLSALQQQLDALESRLPFDNMAAFVLTTSEKNLKLLSEEEGFRFYDHAIRIDHPLANQNPRAIVVAQYHAPEKTLMPVAVKFNNADQCWYILTPDMASKGFEIDVIVDAHPTVIPGISGSDHPDFKVLNVPFRNTQGIAYLGPQWPSPGQQFSVLIFTPAVVKAKPRPNDPNNPPGSLHPLPIDFSGQWNWQLQSAGGTAFNGTLTLAVEGGSITGDMPVSDGTKSALVGTLAEGKLTLLRDTGLATVQVITLNIVSTKEMTGSYVNQGKFLDSGTIRLFR